MYKEDWEKNGNFAVFLRLLLMRRYTCLMKAALVVSVMGLWSCGQHKDELSHGHSHSHEHHSEAESGHHHDEEDDHDHESEHGEEQHDASEIVLEPATAAKFGVVTDTISKEAFSDVIRVTGQILDTPGSASVISAPTAGIVKYVTGIQPGKNIGAGATVATISSSGMSGGDRNAIDRTALQTAERELNRLKPLFEEGIVSAKDYNAALQAYELAKVQYSPAAASGSAKAVSGGVISQLLVPNGQYVEAGTPIAMVSANKRLTLRADVPDKYHGQLPLVNNARIRLPYSEEIIDLGELGGTKVTGSQPAARESAGYIPVYFSFDNNGQALTQTLVDVYLIGAPRYGVVTVPVEAVTEQQGKHFVYVRLDEECYEKKPVTTGASDGRKVEITGGLDGSETVVVKGATAVRLAETSSVVPEGHSHSH